MNAPPDIDDEEFARETLYVAEPDANFHPSRTKLFFGAKRIDSESGSSVPK